MNREEIRAECEERAAFVADYTYGHKDREYFRPMTEKGYPDFALMVDIMGIDVGVLYETRSRDGDHIYRNVVTEVTDNHIEYMEGYDIERSGWKSVKYLKSETALPKHNGFPWSRMDENVESPRTGEHGAVRNKWQQFLDGRLKIVGHLFEVENEKA